MADPKAPEMPEGWRAVYKRFTDTMPWKWDHASGAWLDLDGIRALLSAHGLHIVSEADRKVLEACAAFPTAALKHDAYTNRKELSGLSLRWTEAELARRSGT